ncbi:MAG: DUF1178 family protein [Betaproteobacteria bacterium]
MIIFDLCCNENHSFEGWFQSLSNYESQLEEGLICCPHCGSSEIHRVPSALHLSKAAPAIPHESATTVAPVQTDIRAAFQQLMTAILSSSEDVGKSFTHEARRIHYMEAPIRAIRGEASFEDYETLREEGIDVLLLPIMRKEDLN